MNGTCVAVESRAGVPATLELGGEGDLHELCVGVHGVWSTEPASDARKDGRGGRGADAAGAEDAGEIAEVGGRAAEEDDAAAGGAEVVLQLARQREGTEEIGGVDRAQVLGRPARVVLHFGGVDEVVYLTVVVLPVGDEVADALQRTHIQILYSHEPAFR